MENLTATYFYVLPFFWKILYLEIHVFRNIFIFIIVLKKEMHPHAKAISILRNHYLWLNLQILYSSQKESITDPDKGLSKRCTGRSLVGS